MPRIDPDELSAAEVFSLLSPAEQDAELSKLTDNQRRALAYDWKFHGRRKQQAPDGDWLIWLLLCGRGFGKTRVGAETTRAWAESGKVGRITITGPTGHDIRDAMIEGESGILAVSRKDFWPNYQPSKSRIEWPNGCIGTLISADEPDRFRNKQHEKVWADELAAWKYLAASWAMLMFGLRLGKPQLVATTTPRPLPLIKQLVKQADKQKGQPSARVVAVRGSSYENMTNLAPEYVEQVIEPFVGTELGRQEIEAEIIDETKGALWKMAVIDAARVETVLTPGDMDGETRTELLQLSPQQSSAGDESDPIEIPQLLRIVVAVDPSVSEEGDRDECGIIVAGVGWCDCKLKAGKGKRELHMFVMDDLSGGMPPDVWAQASVDAYRTYQADRVIGEVNQGGALVETTLRSIDGAENVSYESVRATVSKRARAEPVAALYQKGKAHHVGTFAKLEDELTTWVPLKSKSPNRLDALVWAAHALLLQPFEEKSSAQHYANADPSSWAEPGADPTDDVHFDPRFLF